MKKLLLLVSLAAIAAEPQKSSLLGTDPYAASDDRLKELPTGVTVWQQSAGEEVMQITGLAIIQLANPSPFQGIRYARPDNPETIKVVLTTKDGRRWSARWTEEKP